MGGRTVPWQADADRGPWNEALDALGIARERLSWADEGAGVTGPARDFLDAARSVYGQARAAYEGGEYRRAAELARAAEAWSHVPEHLTRAGWEASAAPALAPEPKRKDRGVPPPSPPLKD